MLCIIDEVTNHLIAVPIHQSRSEEIGDALIENVISKYCVPDYIIMDHGSRQHIYVFTYELFVQETQYQNINSGTL